MKAKQLYAFIMHLISTIDKDKFGKVELEQTFSSTVLGSIQCDLKILFSPSVTFINESVFPGRTFEVDSVQLYHHSFQKPYRLAHQGRNIKATDFTEAELMNAYNNVLRYMGMTAIEKSYQTKMEINHTKKLFEVDYKDLKHTDVSPGWQLCPKCNGDGTLARFNSPNTSSSTSLTCDVCKGGKIISTITGLAPILTSTH